MRPARIGLAGVIGALALVASSCAQARHPQETGTTKSTVSSTSEVPSNTTTTAPFAMEPCGAIITNEVVDPTVDLQQFLLTPGDVPVGYTTKGPQVTTGTNFVASVPSTVPVSYITFELGVPSTATSPTSAPNYSISEVIGMVSSTQLAAQLAARIVSAAEQPECLDPGRSVPLSGPVANVTAIENSGSSSAGSVATATVVTSKGPYIINLSWASQTSASQSSSAAAAPSPASLTEIESLLRVALSLIPG